VSKKAELPEQFKGKFSECLGSISVNDPKLGPVPVIDIRGWGYLTGCGALNMHPDEAAKVQDQFTAWVVQVLNNAMVKEPTNDR
jgi:hypothetical protein